MAKIQTGQKIEVQFAQHGMEAGTWVLVYLNERGQFNGWVKNYDNFGEGSPATFESREAAQAYLDANLEYKAPAPRQDYRPRPLTAEEREELRQEREWQAQQAEEEMQRIEQEIIAGRHLAFAGYVSYLESHPSVLRNLRDEMDHGVEYLPVSNEECLFFCLQQICKVGKQYPEGATRQEIRRIYADVKARGGDAWPEQKSRMQQLTK